MNDPVIASTLLLTILMIVGLFFFIRASTKDRTEEANLVSEQSEESLLDQLRQYFGERAYRVAAVDSVTNQVTFEGRVRPSLFLAIFLSSLAAIGMLCLVLVLSMVLPQSSLWFGLLLLSPLAGVFYWKGSDRTEQVLLRVKSSADFGQSTITVKAHRDELAELQRALSLKTAE